MNPQEYFREHNYQESSVLYFEQERDVTWTLVVCYANYAQRMADLERAETVVEEVAETENLSEYHRIQFLQASKLYRTGMLFKTGFQGFEPRHIGVKRSNRPPANIEALTVAVSRGNWTVHLDIGSHGVFDFSCKSISVRTRRIRKEALNGQPDKVWIDAETGEVLDPADPFSD